MQTITPTQVQPIIQAIVTFYGNDFDRVSEFYSAVYPQLHGTHPLTDVVLDALADWLADARFRKYSEPKLHGSQQVINGTTGEQHDVNFDEIDWDEI